MQTLTTIVGLVEGSKRAPKLGSDFLAPVADYVVVVEGTKEFSDGPFLARLNEPLYSS